MPRLPVATATLIGYAKEAYLGILKDDWRTRQHETQRAADDLRERVSAAL